MARCFWVALVGACWLATCCLLGAAERVDPFAAVRALGIIKGAVPVRHIARGVDFATDIARAGQPVVLRGTAAESWPAMSRWADMVELGARLGVITNAQYYRGDQACMFRYWHDEHPLANVPGIAAAYRRVSNSFVNMSGPEYLARVARQVDMYADAHPPHDIECTYYGAPLHNTPELQRDCVPIDEFAVRARPTVTQLWLGAAGLTTHLHYDTSDNFFVQVTGHKRFLLFPPSSSRALYLFPYLHPMHQSSQVDLLRPDLAEFPLFREAHALEVRLSPGDVLFLPTLWGHHVVSEDANAALSIWTYPPEHDSVVASRAAPLPLPTQYRSRVRRALTMRLFLDAMLEAVLGRGRGKIGAAELYNERFAPILRKVPGLASNSEGHSYCIRDLERMPKDTYEDAWESFDAAELYEPYIDCDGIAEEHAAEWHPYLQAVAAVYRTIEDTARRREWLFNTVEMIALTIVVKPENLVAFMRDLATC